MQTILVVDDSSTIRQLVSYSLKKVGYQVIEANDGMEALEKLTKNQVDLLLTDLHMPKMDGFALVKEVRSSNKNKFIPIVVLTTEAQLSKKEEAKNIGVTGWIVKPFEPEQLFKVVKRVLSGT